MKNTHTRKSRIWREAALLVTDIDHQAALTTLHLEKLHADAGKHELKQRGDDQDVADGPDGHKHTLHHVLWRQENTHTPGLQNNQLMTD